MNCRIGNLKLKNRFLLAPMLEPNDVAFRLLCKKAGCGLTYTGMVSPLSKQKMVLDDKPAVQLLFSGDTLFRDSTGRIDLPNSVSEKMDASVERLKGYLDEGYRLMPGHDY